MFRTQTTATSSHQVYSQQPFKHIIKGIQLDIVDCIFYTPDLISCIWQVDKIATTETKIFSCGYNDTGPITGRITPLHSSLYFFDFVSADSKRLPVENKISVWDLSDGRVKIEPGGGLNQPEEFYYLTSVRAYQVKYVQKISFRSRTETRINLHWADVYLWISVVNLWLIFERNCPFSWFGTTGCLVCDGWIYKPPPPPSQSGRTQPQHSHYMRTQFYESSVKSLRDRMKSILAEKNCSNRIPVLDPETRYCQILVWCRLGSTTQSGGYITLLIRVTFVTP